MTIQDLMKAIEEKRKFIDSLRVQLTDKPFLNGMIEEAINFHTGLLNNYKKSLKFQIDSFLKEKELKNFG